MDQAQAPSKGETVFEIPDTKDEARFRDSAGQADDHPADPGRRKRRPWRVVLITLGSVLTLLIVAVIGSYAYVNHVVSSIPRLQVAHLVAATGPSGTLDGQTFLITAYPLGPTGTTSKKTAQTGYSDLVMLLHTNADGKGGGAVTIPGNVKVAVPGRGSEPLWDSITQGGPSLLVQAITRFTGIPINHYARLDFSHIASLVDAIGGIDVTVPAATTGFGYKFTKGVNHLTGVTAIYYGRDPSISAQDRLLRQENIVRTVMTKITDDHLLVNPITMVHVLNAITSMLAVDSNFTNSDVESLARQFGKLAADAATFVTAPTRTAGGKVLPNTALDAQLWTAVKHDSIAAFAQEHPSTVAPQAAP
jgi:LCP family protein required for cell wall assembly